MNSSPARWALVLIIVLVGLAVYSNTLHVPFQWDGEKLLKENQIIRNLDYFAHPSDAKDHKYYDKLMRRYVTYFTFALNYRIHGLSYPGYHVVNISIHIMNALLLFAIALRLFRTPLLKDSALAQSSNVIAFLCGLFFVAHPMQTMVVTYIYQRLASLVALFYLASTLAYLHSRLAETTKKRYVLYVVCLACAFFAMKTKENAVTLPIALIALEVVFFSGPLPKRMLQIVPIFMIATVIPASMLALSDASGGLISNLNDSLKVFEYEGSRLEYLFTQFRMLVKYLWIYAVPVGQSLVHDVESSKSFFEFSVVLSFAFICFMASLAIWLLIKARNHRPELAVISFGIAWFFITHSLESSVFRMPLKFQEYRSYLPSVGIFLSTVTFAMILIYKLSSRIARSAAVLAMATLAIVFAFMAHERNTVWATPMSLWQDVVEKAPMNPLGHTSLGYIYAEQGDTDRALASYYKALELDPAFSEAHIHIANILKARNELDKAVRHLRIAIEAKPYMSEAHNNLASIYSFKGEYEIALKYYQESLKLNPHLAIAWYNVGNLYYKTKSPDKAIASYNRAISIDETLDEAHTNLGAIYVERGNYSMAIEHYISAVRLKPSSPKAHYNLGYVYYEVGNLEGAKAEIERSLSLEPNYKKAIRKLKEIERSEIEQD